MATTQVPGAAEMYQALVDRDPSYDGVFYVAVKTTGIFCRPTCPARKPKRENVAFYPTTSEALRRGFRPCKRCRPMEMAGGAPEWARTLLEEIEESPRTRLSDDDLIARKIDPSRARRYFKERFGMTFHAYHRARRMGLALADVRDGSDLLATGLDNGYDSSSGFRDAFSRLFGEPPGRARSASCLLAKQVETPLGPMLAVAGDDGLCLLEFVDRRAMEEQVATLRKHFPGPVVPGRNEHLDRITEELARYFDGTLTAFTVPLVHPSSPFQAAVWAALKGIPYGQTTSYGAIAARIGRPGASQAVGRANGENRLAIVVPCHRVVRSDGHLCGYAGGLRRKQWLLDLERRMGGGTGWLFPESSPIL
ncbi:MAG: methylated-DNA-[protein]-cysteine methyltransferase [Planctomycetota bacterium]|nr:methylated-DNA-[protein]-cysteine methyltransferase [Planctomycetota bacterium]